jgi:hypothetical protein
LYRLVSQGAANGNFSEKNPKVFQNNFPKRPKSSALAAGVGTFISYDDKNYPSTIADHRHQWPPIAFFPRPHCHL